METYANADAVAAHLPGAVVQEYVPRLLAVAALDGFEVYGDPAPKASAMLAGFGATTFAQWHVFWRLPIQSLSRLNTLLAIGRPKTVPGAIAHRDTGNAN
jgi:hypothetical protein